MGDHWYVIFVPITILLTVAGVVIRTLRRQREMVEHGIRRRAETAARMANAAVAHATVVQSHTTTTMPGRGAAVIFMCAPAHNMATTVPLTNGDNAGVALGVASGMVMGPSRHVTAAFTVLVGGIPSTRMTSMTITNSTNCPGVSIVPSQVKVLVLAP
ncbi:DUF4150 domain-containing protein [Sorangium sp. So ce260]|uniref:DUF4150 domain-containing protein n=1 Tax=Sorangium sp. So ce260 TaxID=3133291 RepID=UPI003F60D9F1